MKKRMRLLGLPILVTVFALIAVGCSDDDDPTPVIPTADFGTGAELRVVHASPDAPAVDVYVEGISTPFLRNVAYGATSEYKDVGPGTYNIQLRGAGASSSSAPAFETGPVTIPDGAVITALAVGLLAAPSPDQAFRVIPLVENFDEPGSGQAMVRIVHGSADAPTVAIDVGNDGTAEIPSLARFADTGVTGVALPANAELQVGIWAGSPLSRVTAFTTPQLPEGADLFVIATGLLSKLPRENDGFSLLAVAPTGSVGFIKQNPVVFALHGSPDAPAVDIYAGNAELIDNLSFGQLSAPVQVPPGSYDLDFRANDDGPVAASATTPMLMPGERYLAVASGFLGDQSFTLLAYRDGFNVNGTNLTVVHASPDAPPVDVGTVDGGGAFSAIPDFKNLAFTESSSETGTTVPAAPLEIGVAAANSTTPVATFDVTTSAGLRAFAVAAGSLQNNGEGFRLVIVNTSVYPWTAGQVTAN